MKTLPLVIVLTIVLCATLADSKPAAHRRYSSYRRSYNHGRSYNRGRSHSSGGRQPNQFLKKVGKAKIVTGAGLAGLGLVTGNSGLTNTGLNVAALGVGSKLLAHVLGKRSIPEELNRAGRSVQ